jgi:hypothetical protein
MTTEQKIKPLMDQIVTIIRSGAFVPEYQEKATPEECVGIAIAKYFAWDTRIFTTFKEALHDANFHQAASQVDTMLDDFLKK